MPEGFEHVRKEIDRNAFARVLYRDYCLLVEQLETHFDRLACLRMLERIFQNVRQHLLQAHAVSLEHDWR